MIILPPPLKIWYQSIGSNLVHIRCSTNSKAMVEFVDSVRAIVEESRFRTTKTDRQNIYKGLLVPKGSFISPWWNKMLQIIGHQSEMRNDGLYYTHPAI